MQKPIICIFCKQLNLQKRLKNQLENQYRLLFPETIQILEDLLKKNEIACTIAYPIQYGICRLWEFHEIKKKFEIVPLIITCPCAQFDYARTCVMALADEFVEPDSIQLISERVQTAIDRCNFQKQIFSTDKQAFNYPPRVEKALKITQFGFTKIKFAEEVSRQLGISVTTFRKEFKRFYGIPFTQYLIQTKLLYAAYLAQNDGLTGKAIAQRCGFNNEHEFYRCFKRKMGMPFSEYRAKHSFPEFNQFYIKNS